MEKRIIYTGFSSKGWEQGQPFTKTNIDLIKEDLYNHIFTEPGERVHMPSFGTRIPSLVFEPDDVLVLNVIEEDLRTVFNYDPRVELLELQVLPLPDNNAIVALAVLKYVELNMIDEFKIQISSGQ